MTTDGDGTATLRLDLLLFYLRFAKSRALAQAMVGRGLIRLDGRRVEKAHTAVRAGQTLTLVLGQDVGVVRILTLPTRRGPAPEARSCYAPIASDSQSATAP